MSRPGKGMEHVERLDADAASKARLRAILETLSGALSVDAACARLSISPSRFHALREQALAGALSALSPAPAGRPPTPGPDATVVALERENAELRDELDASQLRTEIALAFPHLIAPPRGGQKGGSPPKDVGRTPT